MNGTIIPNELKTEGTTNLTGLTWSRSGDIIDLCLYNVSISTTATEITGIPKPKNDYGNFKLFSGANAVGWLEYTSSNQKWKIGAYNTSATVYGTYTYIAG